MSARKKAEPAEPSSALAGRKADVIGECNGFAIKVGDVDAATAGLVLADIIEVFRVLKKRYPELLPDLNPVSGGTPIDVVDDDDYEGRRIGFGR